MEGGLKGEGGRGYHKEKEGMMKMKRSGSQLL